MIPVFSPEAVKAVHHHSKGFPRLINTICENALISGYARQMPTVAAELIREVAEDFRLDVVASPNFKPGHSQRDMDAERAKSFILDLYSATQRPLANNSKLSAPFAVEAEEHESNI
jgi:hypothetical protein